jgi:hypothetical protein
MLKNTTYSIPKIMKLSVIRAVSPESLFQVIDIEWLRYIMYYSLIKLICLLGTPVLGLS